jgi:hypothetical protein
MHDVRLTWLKSAGSELLEGLEKLEGPRVTSSWSDRLDPQAVGTAARPEDRVCPLGVGHPLTWAGFDLRSLEACLRKRLRRSVRDGYTLLWSQIQLTRTSRGELNHGMSFSGGIPGHSEIFAWFVHTVLDGTCTLAWLARLALQCFVPRPGWTCARTPGGTVRHFRSLLLPGGLRNL